MSSRDEDLLDDNFQLLLEESFTVTSSDLAVSRPSELVSQEAPAVSAPAELTTSMQEALRRFYEAYNPENAVRVPQIAAKFETERLKLWEQLCIKYSVSYRASCQLFMEICDEATLDALFGASAPAEWSGFLDSPDLPQKKAFYEAMRTELQHKTPEESIERDVQRTHQDIAFFHEAATKQALVRILQLVTVLNGMNYVQGMHEIAAIIYFVVRDEALSFWVLNEVLTELKDLYNAEVDDDAELGIYGLIDKISLILKNEANNKLYRHMMKLGYPLTTVILRYTTTLLATELTIPDTVRIWEFALRALKSHTLREMATALAVGLLLLMGDVLEECEDLEVLMPTASNFGRSVNFNPDALVRNVAACYAFERRLRGKYVVPQSPSVIAALGDAVEGVLNRVGELLEKLNDDQLSTGAPAESQQSQPSRPSPQDS